MAINSIFLLKISIVSMSQRKVTDVDLGKFARQKTGVTIEEGFDASSPTRHWSAVTTLLYFD